MKILSISKTNNPFKMKNGGTLYSAWGEVEYQEKTVKAKICAYSDKLQIAAGIEYDDQKHNIKSETKQYTDAEGNTKEYIQITVYAEKKEWTAGKGNFGYKKNEYTQKEYDDLLSHILRRCKAIKDKDIYCTVFQSMVKYGFEHNVKITETINEIKTEKKDVPFEPNGEPVNDEFSKEWDKYNK